MPDARRTQTGNPASGAVRITAGVVAVPTPRLRWPAVVQTASSITD